MPADLFVVERNVPCITRVNRISPPFPKKIDNSSVRQFLNGKIDRMNDQPDPS